MARSPVAPRSEAASFAIERFGYPVTLVIDALAGLVCLALLPWIVPRRR